MKNKFKVVYVQNYSLPDEKRTLIGEAETREEQEKIFTNFRTNILIAFQREQIEMIRLGKPESEQEKHLNDFNHVKLFMLSPDQNINDSPME